MSELFDQVMATHEAQDPALGSGVMDAFSDSEAQEPSANRFEVIQNAQHSPGNRFAVIHQANPDGRPERRMSANEARFFAGGLGFKDSVRGITQWAGFREEEMAQEQEQLEKLMADEEYGGSVKAAYYAGMLADPVGWALPVSRLKHLNTVRKFFTKGVPLGAAGGAVAGATGYIPEGTESMIGEGEMGRGEMAGIGTVAGAVMGPAAAVIGKGVQKVYEPIGDAAWKMLRNPAGSTGTVGGLVGYNADPDAPQSDKWANALMGASLGAAAGSASKFTDKIGMTDDLTGRLGDMIVPNYKMASDFIHSINRFRGRKGGYAKDWDELVQGVRELPMDERKIVYRMLQNRNMGLDDGDFDLKHLGLTSEARLKIQDYGQAMVDLGILDDKVFTKNIDDYLNTSYMKHEKGKFEDPLDMLYTSQHMFKMRGKTANMSKAQWERGERPDAVGEWELIDEVGGKVRVRRQWTKPEKKEMGEIEDAAYALQKTGAMMSNERALGEFFQELAQSPDVVLSGAKAMERGVKVPKNGQWGDLGGKIIDRRTWDNIKKFREFQKPTFQSKLFDKYKTANGIWKGLHTIVAPPVHLANVVSSGHMFDMADGAWADVGRAAKNMYKKDEMYDQMVEDGIFGSGVMRELNEGSSAVLRTYAQDANGYLKLGDGPNAFNRSIDWVTKMGRQLKAVGWDNPGKLYQLEDNIWRAALYRTKLDDYTREGIDIMKARGMAARNAKEFFVDYDQNPPLLQGLRQTFLPFFSYTYGTIPRLAEIAAKNPAKYAKWAMIYAGLNAVGENMSDRSRDEINEQNQLQEPSPMFGVPGMPDARIDLPQAVGEFLNPDSDNIQSLNNERWLPGGKFSMTEGGTGQVPWLPAMVQPGGGVAGAVGWPAVGVNQFQGTDVPEGKRAEAALQNLLPNWDNLEFGDFKSYAKKKKDGAGKRSRYGDDYSETTAGLSNAGIRVEDMDTGKMRSRIKWKFEDRINSLKKQIRSVKKRKDLDDAQKRKQIDGLQAEVRKQKDKMQRRLYGE